MVTIRLSARDADALATELRKLLSNLFLEFAELEEHITCSYAEKATLIGSVIGKIKDEVRIQESEDAESR